MIRTLITLFLLFALNVSHAQVEEAREVNLEYDVSLILPDEISVTATITGIKEDSRGNLWFASEKGLFCYDGNKIKIFNNNDRPGTFQLGPTGYGYFDLIKESGDTLWLAERRSHDIVRIDLRNRKEIERKKAPRGNHFVSFRKSDSGDIYHFSRQDSNYYVSCLSCVDDTLKYLSKAGTFYDSEIYKNQIWLNTEEKLSRTNIYDFTTEYFNSEVRLFEVHKDTLWAQFFFSPELHHFDSAANAFLIYEMADSLKHHQNDFALHGKDIWIMNKLEMGLWDRLENTFQDYSHSIEELMRESSPSSLKYKIRHLSYLNNGSIAVSTPNSIILLAPKSSSQEALHEENRSQISKASYREITEDEDGNVYASYYSNLSIKSPNDPAFRPYPYTQDHEYYNHAYSLLHWKGKLIWNNQMIDLESGESHYFFEDEMIQHMENYLEADTLWGIVWYSMDFIKYDLKKDSILLHSKIEYLNTNNVSHMVYDKNRSHFWLATNHGIYTVDREGESELILDENRFELPINEMGIYAIKLQGDSMWFGYTGGLGLYDIAKDQLSFYHSEYLGQTDKIIHRIVYSIIPNEEGKLLLGTSYGLCQFDISNATFSYLIPDHPMYTVEFNRNSAFRASNNQYYFGSITGLYSFREEELSFTEGAAVSDLGLNSIEIHNSKEPIAEVISSDLPSIQTLRLSSSDNGLKFDFSSPNIGNKVYYKYRISGILDGWSEYSQKGAIELVSVPPGKYKLEIRSYLTPESKDFSTRFLKIVKPKIWYNRIHFQALIMALVGLVIGLRVRWRYRLRIQHQQRLEKLRVKISSDLHDDVGTILAGVAMKSELMAYKDFPDRKDRLLDLSSKSKDAMTRMRDIVWALDSRKDNYADLILKMRVFAEKMLENKEINHKFHTEGFVKDEFIDPEKRRNVYLIFKEAIINICKHSNADHVDIAIRNDKHQNLMVVHDNGSIKWEQEEAPGLGLSNMHMRAKEIGGAVEIDNTDGFKLVLSFK